MFNPQVKPFDVFFGYKRFLIFGGTGSLGTALTRRLLKKGFYVGIFSRDEAKNFYHKRQFGYDKPKDPHMLSYYIGDVRNYSSVKDTISAFKPDTIICAAAMKQVPLCEEFPGQAVQTNVLGTENICRAVKESGLSGVRVLSISTDKAVKPINSYGCTKALQEQITLNANDHVDVFANCVRYGNVLESTGSVIPVFRALLAAGQKLTVTDERMTRFLLTLDEAVDLIFTALKDQSGGKIYVPDLRSARILDVAEAMSRAAGMEDNITMTGIRPGEKLHELLISEHETPFTQYESQAFVIGPKVDTPAFTEHMFSSGANCNLIEGKELEIFLSEKGVLSSPATLQR